MTADRDVREFQVVQEGDRLRVRVVLCQGASDPEARARLRTRVAGRLAELGVHEPVMAVDTCAALERPPTGKLQMVVGGAEPASAVPLRAPL